MTTQFRRLFSPVKLGRREAKNRIVSTPHGAAFGEKGGIGDRYIRYHEEKAKGGCGVVMMFGSSSIHPTSVNDWGEVNNWDDTIIPQFRQMSDAIHRHGALCLSQISHRGRRGHSWYSGVPLWAPSDTREERHREWPHVMTGREIREVIDAWAAAAVRLQKGGYDGCDIPFYGGHLARELPVPPDQQAHRRVRGLGSRTAAALIGEVLRAVRDAVGPDFIVGVRHSGDHFVPGGHEPGGAPRGRPPGRRPRHRRLLDGERLQPRDAQVRGDGDPVPLPSARPLQRPGRAHALGRQGAR